MMQHGHTTDEFTRPGQGEFDGVAAYYDELMRTVPYAGWVEYIERILRRWQHRPATVLDLACGTGRVGSEMVKRGYKVLGADLSEPMVRACARQQPPLRALVCDASQMSIADDSFDLIVCLYDSLNYILQPEKLAEALTDAHRILKPGGLFVFDMNTEYALAIGLFTQSNLNSDDPLQYSWEAHWNPKTRICKVDMLFYWNGVAGQKHFRETHYQRAYEADEVLSMLRMAGFKAFEVYSAFTFRAVTPRSDRMYFAALKGGA